MTKILYIEDNDDNVYMLSRRLKKHGFEVLVAGNGEEGIAMALREQPDLILMDLSLPVLNGWDATRQLKQSEATRAIPVIALSSHAMAGDREKALEAGCDEYDTKPVDITSLLTKIRALLPACGG